MDATAQDSGIRAEFTGAPGRFFRIALIGYLLQIPTFGFYRFWLTTDIRRHLWSHTRLGGEAFEYTGRARELLIGFLIALAILTPLYVGYFILSIEAERWKAFASVPFALVIYVLAHYGTYRARRYRATRTIFRGVRLWMSGSAWAYAGRAILWDLLMIATLGLSLPWQLAALERYKMRHTYFGDLQGSFATNGRALFARGWWLWAIAILPMAALSFVLWQIEPQMENPRMAVARVFAVLVIFGLCVLLVLPLFQAIVARWWLEGIRFGELFLISTLRKRDVLWCYVKAGLIGCVYGGVCGIILATYIESHHDLLASFAPGRQPPPEFIALFIAFYLLTLLGMGIIMKQYVTRGIWQVATESITAFNLSTLDAVAARGAPAGSLGEGLADALDFGTGVGL